MKLTSTLSFFTLPLLAMSQEPIFSNSFSTSTLPAGSFIRESSTTLVLPALNSPMGSSFLKIYSELYTNASASLTGTALSLGDDRSPCPNDLDKWCVGVRLVLGNAQNSGEYVAAAPGTQVMIHHKYNDAAFKYEQTISIAGQVVSALALDNEVSLAAGVAVRWATVIECQLAACGTVPSHMYINTKLFLNIADPSFGEGATATGASGKGVSGDGGLTWTYGEIVVDAFTYA